MKLKNFLRERGCTATELARLCGVSPSTISRLANRDTSPSLALIERIRKHTNGEVSADDFLEPIECQPHPFSQTQG